MILGAGTLAQASFSAVSVGLPALAPALRSHYRLSLGQTGVVLGAVGIGMLFTLLLWGLLADRVERADRDRARPRRSPACAIVAGRAHAFVRCARRAARSSPARLGASVNAASGRAVMGWFPAHERGLALGIRQTAIPIGGATAAAACPWLASAGGTRLAFLVLGCGVHRRRARRRVASSATRRRRVGELEDITRPMRDPRAWLLGLGAGFYLTAQIAITGFVVLFLHVHRGVSTHSAAALARRRSTCSASARASRRDAGRTASSARIAPMRVDRRRSRVRAPRQSPRSSTRRSPS